MVRRSFRIGLRFGVLGGVVFAVVKMVQSRRAGPGDEAVPAGFTPAAPRPHPEPARSAPTPPTPPPPAPKPAPKPAPAPVLPEAVAAVTPEATGLADVAAADSAAERTGAADVAAAASVGGMEQAVEHGDVPTPAPVGPKKAAPKKAAAKKSSASASAPAKKAAPPAASPPTKAATSTKATKAAKKAAPAPPPAAWVDPDGGICPTTHPVKAKLSSRLYHLPGMLAYNRTRPDRCYATEDAALADGLTKARR